ncbi:MAG: CBS domain-containing protein [Acetivibrio ethanolgignens]
MYSCKLTGREEIDMNMVFLLRPKSTVAFLETDFTLRQGLEKMYAHKYTAIPVVEKDGRYAGTVSEGDFLWNILKQESFTKRELEEYKLRDIIRPDWNPAVRISATMDDLLQRVMEQNFVPVVDDRNLFMGIITRRDVIKYFCDKR